MNENDEKRCICTSAIAGISDGPNIDCPTHGVLFDPEAVSS